MGCNLKEGMCKGFSLGWIHCTKSCPNYIESALTNNISDYQQWKDWLDRWNVDYEEQTWNPNVKELIIGGSYCQAAIVFDLEDNFKCMTAYE